MTGWKFFHIHQINISAISYVKYEEIKVMESEIDI